MNTFKVILNSNNLPPPRQKPIRTKINKPNLTKNERQRIYELLLEASNKGNLPYGIIIKIAREFNVVEQTVARIWKQGRQSIAEGARCAVVTSNISANSGRKPHPIDLSIIEKAPHSARASISTLSNYTNIPTHLLRRAMKGKFIKKDDVYYSVKSQKPQKKK